MLKIAKIKIRAKLGLKIEAQEKMREIKAKNLFLSIKAFKKIMANSLY